MPETWKEKLIALSNRKELYGYERKQIRDYLRNPLSTEKTFQRYVELFEFRLASRPPAPKTIESRSEVIVCERCGNSFKAEAVYIYGHRHTRNICPQCQKAEIDQEKAREEAKTRERLAATRAHWRQSCGIPVRYQTERFSTFQERAGAAEALALAMDYAEHFPIIAQKDDRYPSLLLYSSRVWGCGKTHLASSIAHAVIDRWAGEETTCPVTFISEPDIYSRIQATYSFSNEERQLKASEQQIIGKLVAARLLIIDDLGKQPRRDMDFVRRTLFEIINRRYNALRPIVVTCNKDEIGLRDYLGPDEAILDRIIEMTQGHRVAITATSYRREKHER